MYFDFKFWKAAVILFCAGLGIAIMLLLGPGCATTRPSIEVMTWAGDPKNVGITRSQDKKTVLCSDPSFDNMVCMSYEDLTKFYMVMLKCRSWDL